MPVAHSFIGDLSDRGPSRARVSTPRMVLGALGLVLAIVMVIIFHLLTRPFPYPNHVVHRSFHRGVARLFGLRLHVHGTRHDGPGTLYLANHASYMDIFILGALLDASFVAKAEVAAWPVLGKLARLQDTLFFERDPRKSAEQIETMRALLRGGRNLIMFPEGTSTDGARVQPFRSTLLAAVAGTPGVAVQGVSIAYVRYDGAPMTPAERDRYAWYLPMTFMPHFVHGLGLRRADVEVRFQTPLDDLEHRDRKGLAREVESQVRAGLAASLPHTAQSAAVSPRVSSPEATLAETSP